MEYNLALVKRRIESIKEKYVAVYCDTEEKANEFEFLIKGMRRVMTIVPYPYKNKAVIVPRFEKILNWYEFRVLSENLYTIITFDDLISGSYYENETKFLSAQKRCSVISMSDIPGITDLYY